MRCPSCDFENREGIKFCENCGNQFSTIAPIPNSVRPISINCLNCGKPNRAGIRFCEECGSLLVERARPTIWKDADAVPNPLEKASCGGRLRGRSSLDMLCGGNFFGPHQIQFPLRQGSGRDTIVNPIKPTIPTDEARGMAIQPIAVVDPTIGLRPSRPRKLPPVTRRHTL